MAAPRRCWKRHWRRPRRRDMAEIPDGLAARVKALRVCRAVSGAGGWQRDRSLVQFQFFEEHWRLSCSRRLLALDRLTAP